MRVISFASVVAAASAAGTWVPGSGFDTSGWVKTSANSPSYVCQYQGVAGFRPYYWSSECDVAVNINGTLTPVRGAASPPDVLQLEPGLAWGKVVPSDGFSITPAGKLSKVCRAFRVGSTSGTMFVGTTSYVNHALACSYYVSAAKAESNADFEFLFLLPPESPVWDGASAPVPVVPSSSPTPSVTPTISASSTPAVIGQLVWVNATHHRDNSGFSTTPEVAGIEGRTEIYVCRGTVPSTGEVYLGKYETSWDFCDIPITTSDGQEVELPDFDNYEILQRSPWLVWSKVQPVNADGTPSASLVAGGLWRGKDMIVCRAFHPTVRSGPHPGYYISNGTFTNDGTNLPACIFSYGGGVIHSPDFDLLYLYSKMPTVVVDNGFGNGTTVVTASYVPTPSVQAGLPSFTPTQSGTPTPSPSSGPVVPGLLQWWSPSPSQRGSGSQQIGQEGSVPIYACRGQNPYSSTEEWIPGKFIPGFNFCNIPLGNKEVIASKYQMLRENPWLRFDGGVSVNATAVVGGTLLGQSLTVCRAKMQDTLSGVALIGAPDLSGYTDGELYHGHPLCFVPYGGKVLRFTSFEVLQMLKSAEAVAFYSPSASYSPSPSNSVSASRTATPSSSFNNVTASVSISASGSVSISASQSPAAIVVLASQSPAASVAASPAAATTAPAASASAAVATASPSAAASTVPASPSSSASASAVPATPSASGTRLFSETGTQTPAATGTKTGTKSPVPTGTSTTVFSSSNTATPSPSTPAQAAGGGSSGSGAVDTGSGSGSNNNGGSTNSDTSAGGGSTSGGDSPSQPSRGPSIAPIAAAASTPTGAFYDGSDAGSVFTAVFVSLVAAFAAIGGFVFWRDHKKKNAAEAAAGTTAPTASAAAPARTAAVTPSSPGAAAPAHSAVAFSSPGAGSGRGDRVPLTGGAADPFAGQNSGRFSYPLPGQPQQGGQQRGAGVSV